MSRFKKIKAAHFRLFCLFLIVGLLSCNHTENKITMEHPNKEQTILRIKKPTRYLLLPVQESAAESRVTLLTQGKDPVTPMHIRIANESIDYYVPYELPAGIKEVELEIYNHSGHPVLWDNIELSDTFDTENREKFRPVFHFSPAYGWMNDPNGLVYLDGEYHLFYQYNPYGSMWGNMHWGHAVSRDLVHWEHLPVAIFPDELGIVFSGNCVIDKENVAGFGKDAMIAFYTSAGVKQTQSIAYSTDKGRTFRKYDKNPVVTADIPDFRDPNVFYYEPTGKWIMVIAAGQEVQLFSSSNLLDWQYESSFGEGYGNHGGVWECPDLVELIVDGNTNQKKWVLILNINPGGIFGGSATQYFTGHFDGKTFTCESTPETVKWMDWGKDHYATITWSNAPQDRNIAIAWMSNWQYANNVPTRQFRSANSVPREISLYSKGKEIYMINHPIKELESLRRQQIKIPPFTVEKTYNLVASADADKGIYEAILEIDQVTAQIFGVTLFNDDGNQIELYYNLTENRFYMDRTRSGLTNFSNDFPAITYAPVEKADTYRLHIYIDTCSIEIFDGEGKFVMTNLVFPEKPYNRATFYSKGGTFRVPSMQLYKLGI